MGLAGAVIGRGGGARGGGLVNGFFNALANGLALNDPGGERSCALKGFVAAGLALPDAGAVEGRDCVCCRGLGRTCCGVCLLLPSPLLQDESLLI